MMSDNKIFLLHIPKTAGTALSRAFRGAVPLERYFEHMESRVPLFGEVVVDGGPFFVSGHFTYEIAQTLIAREDVFSLTVLRDPVRQLESHIKWLKAYGNPADPERLAQIPPPIAELALQLWESDLNCVSDLEKVLERPLGYQLFDNLQVRYLTSAKVSKITSAEAELACENITSFSFYFVMEDLPAAMERLQVRFPGVCELERVNSSMIDESIVPENNKVMDYLLEKTKFDQVLFDRARESSRRSFLAHRSK